MKMTPAAAGFLACLIGSTILVALALLAEISPGVGL